MKGLITRPGNLSDAPGVAMLINHEIRTGLAIWRYADRAEDDIKQMLSERIRSKYALYVAETDGEIVGQATDLFAPEKDMRGPWNIPSTSIQPTNAKASHETLCQSCWNTPIQQTSTA